MSSKILFFGAKDYDKEYFNQQNAAHQYELTFVKETLNHNTVSLVQAHQIVCLFVNDKADKSVIDSLAHYGVKLIALRCAGYNNVDLKAAQEAGITVVRVPAYSPASVAEHTVGLMLSLSRKYHKSYNRIREGNFSLSGLMGFSFAGKSVGIVGTGKIGYCVATLLKGFGMKVYGYDPVPKDCPASDIEYVTLDKIFAVSDVVSLHCPLTEDTTHLIDQETLSKMKTGVMLINTGRGALLDTKAVITALKQKKIGYLGLDVYEQEEGLFFEDCSDVIIQDDEFERLVTFPNVLITGHQGFFTHEAMTQIASTTLSNIHAFITGDELDNQIDV